MKRIVLFLAALFSISRMVADITIPTELKGIVLGKSSSNEVSEILISNGLQFSLEASDSIDANVYQATYNGEYVHEEMCFDRVVARYMYDTLTLITFVGSCDSACINYGKPFIEKIHSKYENLANADSTFLVMMATMDSEEFIKWSRKDDENIVLTMHNDSSCMCAYIAEKRIFEISLNSAWKTYMQTQPDFAEENKVYGVAGVKFGDSKESVKNVISTKSDRIVHEDTHSITFCDTRIGGITYDFAIFYFASNQLVSVNLQNAFYSWRKEEALMQFENIKSQYARKYSNLQLLKDEEDLKGYNCGAYIDGYDYRPILISFQKSLSQGGDIMYYVEVDYYHHRKSTLYDDEI